MESTQTTVRVEEIILLDPPLSNFEKLNWFGVPINRIAVHNFVFCLNLVNFNTLGYFYKIFNLAVFHILVLCLYIIVLCIKY